MTEEWPGGAVLKNADATDMPLRDESVDLIVTSPPYFALRSYTDNGEHYDGQIGSEPTPGDFLVALWTVLDECWRVLKPGGSCWVNLGDKYSQRVATRPSSHQDGLFPGRDELRKDWKRDKEAGLARMPYQNTMGDGGEYAREKSLMGLPWLFALGATYPQTIRSTFQPGDHPQWVLRAEVVWSKPNGLPESVTDRVRRSHEQWFHLTKQGRYFAAVDEVREPHATDDALTRVRSSNYRDDGREVSPTGTSGNPLGKLPGSVWTIPSEPLKVPEHLGVDHFAAFPQEWPRRIILGWSPSGICVECGEGRRPVVAETSVDTSRPQARRALQLVEEHGLTPEHIAAVRAVGTSDTGRGAATQTGTGKNTDEVKRLHAEAVEVLGGYAREFLLQRPSSFSYACACPTPDAPTRPAVVLDPFAGTGTTVMVARALGRTGIGLDLSADYLKLARWRVWQSGHEVKMLSRAWAIDNNSYNKKGKPHTPAKEKRRIEAEAKERTRAQRPRERALWDQVRKD